MTNNHWADTLPSAVTICNSEGIITYMNKKSEDVFKDDGGLNLIGSSIYECHSENSNAQIRHMLESGESNCYTIEKNGKKKLIYQAPFGNGAKPDGLVEISIELPENMPHFIR